MFLIIGAHQNTLENIPLVLVSYVCFVISRNTDKRDFCSTIITGLQFPVYAAAGCAIWTLSRIAYTRGYITGDPKKVSSV